MIGMLNIKRFLTGIVYFFVFLLQECIAKDPNNAEALINMIVLSQHSGKAPEVSNRYLIQLQESHRLHPYVKEQIAKEAEFDRLAAIFCPS